MIKIAIGCDHAGFELKSKILEHLKIKGWEHKDYGTFSEERADYPDFAHQVAEAISQGLYNQGILICGSANGISMTANKHKGIRSAVCWNREIARLARLHNDANILALPGRFIETTEALACIDVFMNTEFEGGRHQDRVKKINC